MCSAGQQAVAGRWYLASCPEMLKPFLGMCTCFGSLHRTVQCFIFCCRHFGLTHPSFAWMSELRRREQWCSLCQCQPGQQNSGMDELCDFLGCCFCCACCWESRTRSVLPPLLPECCFNRPPWGVLIIFCCVLHSKSVLLSRPSHDKMKKKLHCRAVLAVDECVWCLL